MKVIGKITTKTFNTLEFDMEPTTHEVIDIIEDPSGRIYVVNEWYKPNVRQVIHSHMVEKFEESS